MVPSVVRFRNGLTLPARVYLDVNFLLHARNQSSSRYRTASACLRDLILQDVELNVSALVFDELWWALFKSSYHLLTGLELTGAEYKHNVDIWRANWPIVRRIADEILGWERLIVLESGPAAGIVRSAMDLMDRSPLAPRDAFHLALTLLHHIPALVTADSDFDRIDLPRGRELTIVRI